MGVNPAAGSPSALRISVAYYGRVNNPSQLQQAIAGTFPSKALLTDTLPVASSGGSLAATSCVTVVPQLSSSVPAVGESPCPAGSPTLNLDCRPLTETCGDVYPVAVALEREGSSTPLARFTTFITYEEPTARWARVDPCAWAWSFPSAPAR